MHVTNGLIDNIRQDNAPAATVYLDVLKAAEHTKQLNKKILRHASDYKKLLSLVDEYSGELHALNVCTLLHRLAKCLAKAPRRLKERSSEMQKTSSWRNLMELVRKYTRDFNNMELTNCLWSIATLDMRGEEDIVLFLKDFTLTVLDSFDSRNLALSAWALAKMGYTDPEWCRKWAVQVLENLPQAETRDMTMVVWAFATVHWRDDSFLKRFCEEVEVKCERYQNQDIGNTLWALATLGCRHEGALAALVAQCFKKAETFDQQGLSISMWSFATLGYKNMNLLHFLTQQATERISSFTSQGMANTVWACAKFQFQQKCLLMTIAEEAIPRLDEFEPQHLSIMAWAYATVEFPNRPLLSALCKAASRKMHVFSPQHMANMTWAMATLAHKDEEYLQLLAQRSLQCVEDFNPQECSNLAWAFALLTFRNDELLAALSLRSQEIVADFIPQNLGNSAWAYNRLGYRDVKFMQCLVEQAAQRLHECQGQEIFDLVEAVSTGDYTDVMGTAGWYVINAWIAEKYDRIARFLDTNSDLPLTFPNLSEFDRALAVQDYRDAMGSFNLIGLGFTNTSKLLVHLGLIIPDGVALEEWCSIARVAAVGARNESDLEKNKEAQEGLKACRTVCVYQFSVVNSRTSASVKVGPVAVASGPPNEAYHLGLFAGSLKHNRGGDGEFQALQAVAQACLDLGCSPLTEGRDISGEVWLHVSEVPCMSCVGAMAQFRQLFPHVQLHIYFVLGRQPASTQSNILPVDAGAGDRKLDSSGSLGIINLESTTQTSNRSATKNNHGMSSRSGNSKDNALANGHSTNNGARAQGRGATMGLDPSHFADLDADDLGNDGHQAARKNSPPFGQFGEALDSVTPMRNGEGAAPGNASMHDERTFSEGWQNFGYHYESKPSEGILQIGSKLDARETGNENYLESVPQEVRSNKTAPVRQSFY